MSQGGYKGPPQSSGGGGGTVVMIILAVGAMLGLGCLGVCGLGLFGFAFTAQPAVQQVQAAEVNPGISMEMALGEAMLVASAADMIVNDAHVKEALGEPVSVEPEGLPSESVSGDIHSFDLPVSGTKATATGHVEGQRNGTGWEVLSVKVTLGDGSTIDISHNAAVPGEGAIAPALPPEITDPPPSSDPVPGETTP